MTVAAALMDELRRRRIIATGPSIVERLVAAVLVVAERHVAGQLTAALSIAQSKALNDLLDPKKGASMSTLAWARQPPGAPGHKALDRIVQQLTLLRAIGLDPACAEGVHPERLRKLAREGERFTAQHLRALSLLRRRATLIATVLDTTARLTDDGIGLFDRAVGRMFRRAEAREEDAVLRDARAANDKVRLFAKLGAALIAAKEGDADLDGAVALSVGWEKLAASVAEAERLARPDRVDMLALATRAWPVLHRLGPVFLDAFQFRAVPAAAATLRAVEVLHETYGSGRKWPKSPPTSFLRPAWRDAVRDSGGEGSTDYRRTWEAATLLALRDRLRSGDIWVQGSRQWRAIEDQLISPALFAAMRAAGPLPVAVPASAEEYLAGRRALLERRMGEINAKAAADALEDVRITGDALKTRRSRPSPRRRRKMRQSGSTPWCRTLASRTCWPTCIAGPGLPTPSPTCTPACRPTTRASCSPACWPMPPTSARPAWRTPARSPAIASWSGPQAGTCARTPPVRPWPSWSTPSSASRLPRCSVPPMCPAPTARPS